MEAEEMAEAEHGALRQRYWRAGGHRLNVERKAMQALNDYCPQTIEEAAEIARYLLALKTRHHADHQDFESLVRRLAGM
ncbi:MAG TPA: hypothetical protein VN175_04935 [Rhizomicrobium sp.]|nr:hypothetical protein [Rhizomicrobium sp.]